jgi:hypothetical protein
MGRPPGRIQHRLFQMRVSDDFLRAVDRWRSKQEDEPSRAEAIRHLVQLGLTLAQPKQASRARVRKVQEMAGKQLDQLADQSATSEEQASRKRRLLKGPEEFRGLRVDRPKPRRA